MWCQPQTEIRGWLANALDCKLSGHISASGCDRRRDCSRLPSQHLCLRQLQIHYSWQHAETLHQAATLTTSTKLIANMHLLIFQRMVEGLVLAMPPTQFLTANPKR